MMQLSLFEPSPLQQKLKRQLLYDLFQAYYDARRNKRNTKSSLAFEQNYESNLFSLYDEIKSRNYKIKPSVCFINYSPVKREIFAADFRDRIVHHLIYNYISPVFERIFINDSYSCRTGKGTSYGINRLQYFMKSCSDNYNKPCFILKLDIKGYFMAIVQDILYDKTVKILKQYRYRSLKDNDGTIKKWNEQFDFDLMYYLLKEIIYNKPVDNHIRKGNITNWYGLPPSKSLFYSAQGCGLPIGNLTSQLFSNIYLNDFDHHIKCHLQCKYYGRYVDDFFIVHTDRYYLKDLIPKISIYLKEKLQLELHPNKIYLQPAENGVQFLGATIKPHRSYLKNRTKGNFYKALQQWNDIINGKRVNKLTKPELRQFVSCINSYLGLAKQYNTYKLRKQMILQHMAKPFWNYVYLCNNQKLVVKKKYKIGII